MAPNPHMPYTPAMAFVVYFGWLMAAVAIACAVGVRTSRRVERWVANIPLSTWSFTTIVLAIGTYFLFYSQQVGMLVEEGMGIAFVDSVVRTIKCFSASDEATLVEQAVHHYFAPGLDKLYLFTNSLTHLAAPVDTLMGIFILFTKFFGAPVLRFRARGNDTYIFSRLNDRSMRMAQNIVSYYKETSGPLETENCLIGFARTAEQEGDPLYNDAITHGMVCLDQPTYAVARFLGDSSARHTYIFADDDEVENLQEGTRFVRDYVQHAERHQDSQVRRPEAYLLSSTPVAESFVDAATADAIVPWSGSRKPVVSVRRADWVRNTIETLLWRMPIFLTTRPTEDEDERQNESLYHLDRRRVVIVGGGTIGYEFLKAALWCSQLGDIHFTYDVIDLNDASFREHLAYDAPEILSLSGDAPGAEYDINILGIDALSGSYVDHIKKHRDDITYVIISLGNDLANVRVARRTREILEQGSHAPGVGYLRSDRPLVAAVVSDEALAASVEAMRTGNGIGYDIVTVGSYERIYSFQNMFRFELDRLGRNVNRAYWGCYDGGMSQDDLRGLRASADAEYERLEYNRRSSRASAIHLKYDLYAFVRRSKRLGEDIPVPALTWQEDFFDQSNGAPTSLSELVARYEHDIQLAAEGEESSIVGMEWMSRIEHDRWDAYMRTEGYECADQETFEAFLPYTRENQNRLAKQHVCLVPFDVLDEVSDFVYPQTMRDRDRDYKLADEKIVRHVADIVRDFED